MRPERPLPTSAPFLTLYTNTYQRPTLLARCLASVSAQTAADDLDQLVLPDHVRYGVGPSLYGRVPWYAAAVRGKYVNFLCDDAVLASDTVVAELRESATHLGFPPVISVIVEKNGRMFPACDLSKGPVCGAIDLTSYIIRQDIWQAHVKDYTMRYEGDFDHAQALWQAGYGVAFLPLLWARGGAMNGRPE